MDGDAVLARLVLLTEDDRTALLETLAGDAVRVLESRLHCTEAEKAAQAQALEAAAARMLRISSRWSTPRARRTA